MPHAHLIKSERVNLRLDAAAKRQIERAALAEGRTVSSFILASALENAEETIRRHEVVALSRRDAEIFLDAILNPPPANAKLHEALAEHDRRVVSR